MLLFAITGLAFLAAALFAAVLHGLFGRERDALTRRLEGLQKPVSAIILLPSLAEAQLDGGWQERLVWPWLRRLAWLGNWLTPAGSSARLRASLARAGNPAGLGAGEFVGLRLLCSILCSLLALALCPLLPNLLLRVCFLCLGLVIGLTLPETILESRIRRRQSEIRRALPEMIDLLVVSVEAGMGLDGALRKVTEKMSGPLAAEITRAREETALGKTRAAALKEMAARLEMREVRTFVAAVTQAEQLGTSIVRVLRAQSLMARTARMQRIREQAAKLPVTMLFPLALFIFPAIFVVLLGPSLMRLASALGHLN
jgi:tight adherence protein C